MKNLRFKLSKRQILWLISGVIALGSAGVTLANLGGAPRLAATSDIALQKGLVAWYKMDGNGKDSTPYGNNLTNSGATATADRKGKANSAMNLDGNLNYMSAPNAAQLNSGSVTVSTWFTLNADPSCDANNNWRVFLNKGTADAQSINGWDVVLEDTKAVQFDVGYGGATHRTGQIDVGLAVGTPVLLTFTYDATTGAQDIYANGALKYSGTITATPITSNSSPLLIGKGVQASCPNQDGYAPGAFDDLRIYNRAISASEATALYDSYDRSSKAAQGEKGLVGWWKMDGSAKDSSPYSNSGTVSGATLAADRKGSANSSYSFNGTSSFIDVPDSSAIDGSMGSWSVWTKVGAVPGGNSADIMDKHDVTNSNNGLSLTLSSSGTVQLQIKGSSSVGQCTNTTAINDGNWHLLTATFNGTSPASLYIDASNPCSFSPAASWSFSTQSLRFGKSVDSFWSALNGTLDDARIYNRVLTPSDITSLYASYNSQVALGGSPGSAVQLGRGLVGDWALNGNAKDSTPYSDNGTATGASLVADRKSRPSSAYSFNGSTQYITIPNNPALRPTTGITVSAWFNLASLTDSQRLLSSSESGGYTLINLVTSTVTGCTTNSICFDAFIAGSYVGTSFSTALISTGSWNHVVATYDGSNFKIYLNGVLKNSNSVSGVITEPAGNIPVCIGSEPVTTCADGGGFLNGSMDDVRIWNRALSQAEISVLFAEYR